MTPMLGDVLAAARRSAAGFVQWLEAADPELARRIATATCSTGESPTVYVRTAVAEFGCDASEEDWATLTSRLRDCDDPGSVCLSVMVERRLAVERVGQTPQRTTEETG